MELTVESLIGELGLTLVSGQEAAQGQARIALDAPARILLVDDDDMVRETLAAQLEDLGLNVLVASNGAEAFGLLAQEPVDALVSDLSMP